MPRLRRLFGADVISILQRFGFEVVSRRGSHVKLVRSVAGSRQVLTVPDHRQLDSGTCRAIFRLAAAYIPEVELSPHFMSD